MSNFSFYNIVFKTQVLQTRKNTGLFGKWLTDDKILEWTKLTNTYRTSAFEILNFFAKTRGLNFLWLIV